MGKQINFYAIEQDYDLLLELAEEKGLHALPRTISSSEYEAGVSPRRPVDLYNDNIFLLPKDISVDTVTYLPTKDSNVLWLDYTVSPVIEFLISQRQDDKISHGRFFVSSLQTHRYKSEVGKAYDKLARYIRSHWEKHSESSFYIGPYTKKLHEQAHLRLRA